MRNIWNSFGLLLFFLTNVFCFHWPPDAAKWLKDGDSFHFIVVGSGSGGAPVAARLAERGQSVLLLEAGGKPPLTTVIPGTLFTNLMTDVDWQFKGQYDCSACQSTVDKRCYKPRGKVLGGTSAINFMTFIRGNKVDFDEWNITSWTYNKMLPYFRRMESLTDYDDLPPELKQYHNNNGPLRVSLLNESDIEWRENLVNAYQEIGLVRNRDANGPSQIGVTVTHTTVFAGERQSTAEAYLVPNSNNNNLNVAYNSFVTKVIIDKSKVAKGVRVSIDGQVEITIYADKEIIISGGTISTPQLLMLSGIGPALELETHGIHVHVDNPHVGQNLQDHPATPIVLAANTGTATPIPDNATQIFLYQWLTKRSGPLSEVSVTNVVSFVDTARGSAVPDTQYIHAYLSRSYTNTSSTALVKIFNLNDALLRELQDLNMGSEILVIIPTLIHPKARGSIHLSSRDPYDYPSIYGNKMEPEDYATLLRGIRLLEKLLTTETFLKNDVKLAKIKSLKECNDLEFQSDDYWVCYHNHVGNDFYHPVGTAAIGRVVDERLRVYGVRKLRVADASVMPFIPRGNTNAPTIAIGERAADFIAEDNEL